MTPPTSPHIPVLLAEMLTALSPKAGEVYVDATFGAGGYSTAIATACPCTLYSIDRDPNVAPYAETLSQKLNSASSKSQFLLLQGEFADMEALLAEQGITAVDGIVMDIGVSSMQLDEEERGFSFMRDGPLDMRMSQNGRDAAWLVNNATEEELADIIYHYGDERYARKIARKIVAERVVQPITRTIQLASLVRSIVRGSHDGIDPATRTFQAIRIWVNEELDQLERALQSAEKLLRPGGRLVVICFHSLEDRIVKQFMHHRSGKHTGTSRFVPALPSGPAPSFTLLTKKAISPSAEEVAHNVRARSAKLRAAIRTNALPFKENSRLV